MTHDMTPTRGARLAAMLDADPEVTPELLRSGFPDWLIWSDDGVGRWHARRSENIQETADSPRRFHLVAGSVGELAVLLLAQHAVDAAEDEECEE